MLGQRFRLKLKKFLSTPSARRATSRPRRWAPPNNYFYPRPPRGGRPHHHIRKFTCKQFLSTPSARRATQDRPAGHNRTDHFYPRPPRGGRRAGGGKGALVQTISIHALREEGDDQSLTPTMGVKQFLSTPSARRATRWPRLPTTASGYFYPRPPRGGRHRKPLRGVLCIQFLSTPSARRATKCPCKAVPIVIISIHALREEGDGKRQHGNKGRNDFYPRPPRGGRRKRQHGNKGRNDFYPRPPRGGRPSFHEKKQECV